MRLEVSERPPRTLFEAFSRRKFSQSGTSSRDRYPVTAQWIESRAVMFFSQPRFLND